MKKITSFMILLILPLIISSCSKGPVKLDFAVVDSVYNLNGIDYPADYCKMQILENPNDYESKIIDIPVIRIRTNSTDPGAPVFILNDGPGLSNFTQIMPTWLASNHDVVIIGYRGIDGSVNLNLPEVSNLFLNNNFLSDDNIELVSKAIDKGFDKLSDSLEIDINQYNIVNIAHDIESARIAFQYKRINIYCVGFGARIAQVYIDLSPVAIFRVFMERPKAYGSLTTAPGMIDKILSYYNNYSMSVNDGMGFKDIILKALNSLPEEHQGHRFDKDKIIYRMLSILNSNQGAAMINEACNAAILGDYDGIKFLEETFATSITDLNFGDYIIKSTTSEYENNKNYIKNFAFNPQAKSLGSPISKFIFGSVQKSNFKPVVIDKNVLNPDSLRSECLLLTVNLDIFNPYEKVEFEMKNKFKRVHSIILSDYTPQDLYIHNTNSYLDLIGKFLYVGDYFSFTPSELVYNIVPTKTLKQISLERIQ